MYLLNICSVVSDKENSKILEGKQIKRFFLLPLSEWFNRTKSLKVT